jgi:hypothetical protein
MAKFIPIPAIIGSSKDKTKKEFLANLVKSSFIRYFTVKCDIGTVKIKKIINIIGTGYLDIKTIILLKIFFNKLF